MLASDALVPPVDVAGATIVVTGGAGFIGSHLVSALLGVGAGAVRVLDDLRCGDPARLGNGGGRVELVRCQLGCDDPSPYLRGARFVFHLAAEKHNQSRGRPQALLRSNVEGTYDVYRAAADAGVERVVFSSSLYAYGRMSGPPSVETDCPQPITPYGISKLAGEQLLRHFARERGLAGTVLRLYFVYGPRQFAGTGYKSVIVRTFERLLADEPGVVNGDGLQALDYVYVDDVVAALLGALSPAAAGETFNVASGTAVAVRDLVAHMTRVAGSERAPVHAPADWTAGTSRAGTPDKIAAHLGWRPQVDLDEGLTRTLAWIRSPR